VTETLGFTPADVSPDRGAVLAQLGIPEGTILSERIERLITQASGLLAESAAPAGVFAELPVAEFAEVCRGEGRNAPDAVVGTIAPQAEHLAFFAVTLGPRTSDVLAGLFAGTDFALAYVLDAMASVGADELAGLAEQRYAAALRERGWRTPDGAVLRYSPGYCGWDITGQRKLFARLRPEGIGLTLNDSCLMRPLKSVSGVLVAGPRAIHRFPPTYDFCERCEERTCRDRLAALVAGARD
jgi:hypothetical protein